MTEETILKTLISNTLFGNANFNNAAKQLLEQHEAEMMDFTEWKDANYVLFSESPNKYVDRIESIGSILDRNPSKILPRFTTTNLLTLFKNRNK